MFPISTETQHQAIAVKSATNQIVVFKRKNVSTLRETLAEIARLDMRLVTLALWEGDRRRVLSPVWRGPEYNEIVDDFLISPTGPRIYRVVENSQ